MEEMKNKIEAVGKEIWLKGNLDALDEIYAADYVWHRPPFPDAVDQPATPEEVLADAASFIVA